jgi:hypothetical protein
MLENDGLVPNDSFGKRLKEALAVSNGNANVSKDSADDMRSALTILETILFQVGPELLRKDIRQAIQHLKHGVSMLEKETCTEVHSTSKTERELGKVSMPEKHLSNPIGPEAYHPEFAHCGTTKENALKVYSEAERLKPKNVQNTGKLL